MRNLISLLLVLLTIWIALPALVFGLLGVTGSLIDGSCQASSQYGVGFLLMTGFVCIVDWYWFRRVGQK